MSPVDLPNLGGLDETTRTAINRLKRSFDANEAALAAVQGQLQKATGQILTLDQVQKALQVGGSNPLNVTGLTGSPPPPPPVKPTAPTTPFSPPTPSSIGPPTSLVCSTNFGAGQPSIPGPPNIRYYRGNFCGVRVSGLPTLPGGIGSDDTSLVFTPFTDLYSPSQRQAIYAAHQARGFTHYQLSPFTSFSNGTSVADFLTVAAEVKAAGFYVVMFMLGKGMDPNVDNVAPQLDPLLSTLISNGLLDTCCVGWELSLWMDPTQTQAAIDHITAFTVPAGIPTYVHFQVNYTSFPQPGDFTAVFWQNNVGKLSGLYFQGDPGADCGNRQERIIEGLQRFAGNDFYPTDCGFGHPFDFVPWELSANDQFFNGETEAQGNQIGFQALCTPAQSGPAGTVFAMGFGNGATQPNGAFI